METYERSDINGILDARGTDIEYCPTFVLRRCLDAHHIPSLHLTRKQCISKMRDLGYIRLREPHAIDPYVDSAKTIISKPQYARTFVNPIFENQDKTRSATRSVTRSVVPLTFEQTQNPLVYRPSNPLYDASFNTLVCDQLHTLHNLYVQMTSITDLVNELDTKVDSIQTNLNQVETQMDLSESEVSRGVFEYKQFSNITSPFINLHHGKGVFIPVERLIDNRLIFDYDTSYVHIREQQTMYDIIIEIQNLGWFDKSSVEFRREPNVGFHLMDIKTFTGIQNQFEFDPDETIITKYMKWNYSASKWELNRTPGTRFNDGNVYVYTNDLNTFSNFGTTTNADFMSFRFQFTALKRTNVTDTNVTNPFMTGLRKSQDVAFLASNAASLSVRGFHQWVDSPDRVVLSTLVRVKHPSVTSTMDNIPAFVQIELDVPHTTIEHGNTGYPPCPYTGTGLIMNTNKRVDVRLDRNEDNTKSVMKIVLESKYLPISGEEIEITVDIGYSLETKNISYITPIVKMDYEMNHNTISITNTDVKDSVNLDGELELNEYYNIVHTLTETHRYNKDINTIFVDYDVNQTYAGEEDKPQLSIQNIRVSNSNIEANEPQLLDFTYNFEMVINDTTNVYTSVTFPDDYVPVDDYVLDVVDDRVFARIRYEDFEPTLRVYAPADPDSIQVTVLQHVPDTQPEANIEYRVMDADTIQANVSSALHMLVPSTTYVRVRDVGQTVRFLTDNLVGFIHQEGLLQELGKFASIQIRVNQN